LQKQRTHYCAGNETKPIRQHPAKLLTLPIPSLIFCISAPGLPYELARLLAVRLSLMRMKSMLQCVCIAARSTGPGAPPCMPQRFLPATAGDRQDLPDLVRAP
jgi:hypothetical protein